MDTESSHRGSIPLRYQPDINIWENKQLHGHGLPDVALDIFSCSRVEINLADPDDAEVRTVLRCMRFSLQEYLHVTFQCQSKREKLLILFLFCYRLRLHPPSILALVDTTTNVSQAEFLIPLFLTQKETQDIYSPW